MLDEIYDRKIRLTDEYDTSGLPLRNIKSALVIPEGTILVEEYRRRTVMFEVAKPIRIPDNHDDLVASVPGSIISYPDGESIEGLILRKFVRFPKKDELDWYKETNTV